MRYCERAGVSTVAACTSGGRSFAWRLRDAKTTYQVRTLALTAAPKSYSATRASRFRVRRTDFCSVSHEVSVCGRLKPLLPQSEERGGY